MSTNTGAHGSALRGKLGLVLILVTASVAVQLLVTGGSVARFVLVLLQAATLVVAVMTAGARRGVVRFASLAAATAATAALVLWVVNGEITAGPAALVNGVLVAVAPGALAAGLVRDLRTERTVTVRTVAGVLAIYLLIGMFFSFLYGLVGAIESDALFAGVSHSTAADQLYFSFVTLSTVGYGDLAPAGDVSRALAVFEMLLGQIYLVTVVALIIGNLGRAPVGRGTTR
jgi:voltage-gated potassium channel